MVREPYHVHFWGKFCGEATEARKWVVAVISGAKGTILVQMLFINSRKGLTILKVCSEQVYELLC